MLLFGSHSRSRFWSRLTTKILCFTLQLLLFGFVSSIETDTWLNTFELQDDTSQSVVGGVKHSEPNLDDTRLDALNSEYPSNLQRIKRSPLLGRYIKDVIDKERERRRSRQPHPDDPTSQNGVGNQKKSDETKDVEKPAFRILFAGGGKPLTRKRDEKKKAPKEVKKEENGSGVPAKQVNKVEDKKQADVTDEPSNDSERRIVFDLNNNNSTKKKNDDGKPIDRIVVDIKKEVKPKADKKESDNKVEKKKLGDEAKKGEGGGGVTDRQGQNNLKDDKEKAKDQKNVKEGKPEKEKEKNNIAKSKKDKNKGEEKDLEKGAADKKSIDSGKVKPEPDLQKYNTGSSDTKTKPKKEKTEVGGGGKKKMEDPEEVDDDDEDKDGDDGYDDDYVNEKTKKPTKVDTDPQIKVPSTPVPSNNTKPTKSPETPAPTVLNTTTALNSTTVAPQKMEPKPQKTTVTPVVEGHNMTTTVVPSTIINLTNPTTTSMPTLPVYLKTMRLLTAQTSNSSHEHYITLPFKNSTLPNSILRLASSNTKSSSKALHINSSVLTNEPIVIKPNFIFYDPRDVTYFLESHPAHSVHDPRAYFTEERITRAMAIILKELPKMPENLRFAYVVRTLNELGRKIASKLNYLTVEISAILRKTPDDLGNKPDVSMIINTVKNVFESKEDRDPLEETSAHLDETKPIKKLIGNDVEKAIIFGQAGKTIAVKTAELLSRYLFQALRNHLLRLAKKKLAAAATLFCDALKKGVGDMIAQMDKSDKFKVYTDMKEVFKEVIDQMELVLKDIFKNVKNITDLPKEANFDTIIKDGGESFADLNPISHRTALIGPYNTFLFNNLGSSERVIKLFGSLVSRVPPEAKARWINMYESRFDKEFKHTLSGFVTMQGMPSTNGSSDIALLDVKNSSLLITSKLPVAREDYDLQKNKIPARCYLAGRRSRLYLKRGLKHFEQSEKIITRIANKLSKWKATLVHQSGNEIYRMCLPRVEVGLRSWGINGDPRSDGSATSKFQMKNPLESLNTMRDPFENGVQLGYRIGAKIGYNEERNATLELEYSGGSGNLSAQSDSLASRFIGRAAYRKATTAAAEKAFGIAVREGYITALKVSIRAGLKIPAEAGSKMAALKCISVAAMTGMEVGGSFADEFLINKDIESQQRDYFIKLGKEQGSAAGMMIGEKIGAFVGREAAEEAYRRAITRGGKLERAKFHLEEYEAGARIGFEYGLKVGKRVASSSNLDPSAPKLLLLPEPFFSKKKHHEDDVDHWEKDLIPSLTERTLSELEQVRDHIPIEGTLTGSYTVVKEVKSMWSMTYNTTKTYQLAVKAKGYITQDVAYLNLNGTVNELGTVYGSIITRDIFLEESSVVTSVKG